MIKSETAMADREALISTGGVVSKANGNPKVNDFIEALKKMGTSYSTWKWNPIPINNGILFKFPTEAGLNILTRRDVIPCNNGHFVVRRWNDEREGTTHNFPIKMTVLAFNLPPYLRTEPDLARMVANFAHLIEATQVMKEGGPMKLTLGCRRRADIPKELPVIFGGKEHRIVLAVREVMGERQNGEERGVGNGEEGDDQHRDYERGRGRERGLVGEADNKRRRGGGYHGGLDSGEEDDGGGKNSGGRSSDRTMRKISQLGQTERSDGKREEKQAQLGSQTKGEDGKRPRVMSDNREGGGTRVKSLMCVKGGTRVGRQPQYPTKRISL